MRTRVDRLRTWLVAGSLGLLLVVGGFLGYARYRSRVFLAGLPGRLGANITRETDGYTYSQTVEGRTVFTLHAAKMEQQRDGLVKLHDVGVVAYGRKQDRADRIYGREFEYDQASGVVRALGVVDLDLQAPAPAEGKRQPPLGTGAGTVEKDARVIHVRTSGLVYLTKLGVAATGEDVEFSEGSITGHSHGAEFSSDTGLVVLQSTVRLNGLTANGPMVLTAGRAELDRNTLVATLEEAKLIMTGEAVAAVHAVVHVRTDGSPERLEGSGGVAIARTEGGTLRAERADAELNAGSKPTAARFAGAVRFLEDDEGRHAEGQSATAEVRFNGVGQPEHVFLGGGVHLAEREGATDRRPGSRRTLGGSTVEVALAPALGRPKKIEVREAHAMGGARLMLIDDAQPARKRAEATTELSGDDMTARFAGGQRMTELVAVGHSALHQVDGAGVGERSAGDRTEIIFRSGTGTATSGAGQVERAVQNGHVQMTRTMGGRQNEPAMEQRGTAERAVFDGEANQVTLTGSVVVTDALSTLRGATVIVDRASGDATVQGDVRMNYVEASQAREAEPMHVLADHAMLRRGAAQGTDQAIFYGTAGKPARLWQGGSQVEAPILEFDQGTRRLTAHGGEAQVHAVLVPATQPAPAAREKTTKSPGTVRIVSKEMVYADADRDVVFTGGVLVADGDGTMRAERATAFLQPKAPAGHSALAREPAGKPAAGSGLFSGEIQRIVAEGKVDIYQTGRRGTGERLVYTAADGMFVLSGTPTAPPRVVDEARGTVTGATLRFHRGDDSVVVTRSGIERGPAIAGRPDRTETRVKQQ